MRTLLTLTLSGSALALLLLAMRRIFGRRMPSTVYYYAWLLVLLRFLLPAPGLVPAFSAAAEAAAPAERAAYTARAETADVTSPAAPFTFATAPDAQAAPAYAQTEAHAAEAKAEQGAYTAPAAPAARKEAFNWKSPALWLTVWAAGAAACFGHTVFAYVRFSRALRRSLERPDAETQAVYDSLPGRKPALYCSTALQTPLMCGVFRPRIVLPARLCGEEQLFNVLCHEITHYRRGDTLYKWFAVAVLSLHWFNPLVWGIRREIDRACELSCDEMLLRSMDREGKRSYGNTLLNMAAGSPLPAGVVATTFSTEKKNLKERLEQIMNYNKKNKTRLLAAVLTVSLLAGCGAAAGPAAQAEQEAPAKEENVVKVSTVDEFLDAIAPNTVIELAEGTFDLSAASDYAKESDSRYYAWSNVYTEESGPGAELEIRNVENLTIRGAGMDKTVISAVPRYANVLKFYGCYTLTLEEFTAGHTIEPGYCSGGVLDFEVCSIVSVDKCGLYGCGSVGVWANDCSVVSVTDSDIYECSYNAVSAYNTRSMIVDGCRIYGHGTRPGTGSALSLFDASNSDSFIVHGCVVNGNECETLMRLNYTKNAAFLSNDVHNNRFGGAVFGFEGYGATVDGCAFENNGPVYAWVQGAGVYAGDMEGNILGAEDFENMELREIDPGSTAVPAAGAAATEVAPGASIEVTTVDEFLAAIGPERTIVLNAELFDLSEASNYGAAGGNYYYWASCYDGPALVIRNVSGLTIESALPDPAAVTLSATPRYADVLRFESCERLVLAGFTAGHTKEPGSCAGGVVYLQDCSDVTVESMRLYGCGVLGLQTDRCGSLSVLRTEIYECSQGAGSFYRTDGIRFEDCDVHDVPSPAFYFAECGDKTWDRQPIDGLDGSYDLNADGGLTRVMYGEPDPYDAAFEQQAFTFAEDAPEREFAASVQKAVSGGNWETLADMIWFPLKVVDADGNSLEIADRAEFLKKAGKLFSKDYRNEIAAASLDEYGGTLFGVTCLGHKIAFTTLTDNTYRSLYLVTVMSAGTPLWPGEFPYEYDVP